MTATASLTYLTPDLPGVGGVLKQSNEDFLVEEQPLYDLCGEGEHVYLYIEKSGLTTTEAVLFELCEVAGTPEFKEISRLVKEGAGT